MCAGFSFSQIWKVLEEIHTQGDVHWLRIWLLYINILIMFIYNLAVSIWWPVRCFDCHLSVVLILQLLDQSYIDVLQLFGDSEDSPFSIHNLLQAGKAFGLAPGSWVGPYAMCRTWETLVRGKREENKNGGLPSMMTIYVVSGDEDGEHGGAPVLCFQDISRHCFEFSRGEVDWTPVLMLVPLVLGLDKVNPRYGLICQNLGIWKSLTHYFLKFLHFRILWVICSFTCSWSIWDDSGHGGYSYLCA